MKRTLCVVFPAVSDVTLSSFQADIIKTDVTIEASVADLALWMKTEETAVIIEVTPAVRTPLRVYSQVFLLENRRNG